jgi:hypothetical protein
MEPVTALIGPILEFATPMWGFFANPEQDKRDWQATQNAEYGRNFQLDSNFKQSNTGTITLGLLAFILIMLLLVAALKK